MQFFDGVRRHEESDTVNVGPVQVHFKQPPNCRTGLLVPAQEPQEELEVPPDLWTSAQTR